MNEKLNQVAASPATITLTSRVDMRHLATLGNFWAMAGEQPRSVSELVRVSLETFSEFLVTAGKVEFIQGQEEAKALLEGMGLNVKKVIKRNLVEALLREQGLFKAVTKADPPDILSRNRREAQAISQDSPEVRVAQMKIDETLAMEQIGAARENTAAFKQELRERRNG